MKLRRLTIANFKGLDKVEIAPQGKNVAVCAKNGVGKTCLSDAYAWAMTGKGFDGQAIDTQIKKRAEDGSTPNDGGVEHSVEVELEQDDGRPVIIRREFKEEWTKKRGTSDQEFKGHTSTYSIDGVPLSKKEYDSRIGELIKGDIFPLLSMPFYFCSKMKWKDRRALLMKMAGEVTDEDIIKGNPGLELLSKELEKHSIADYRKILQSKMKKNNEEVKTIPARIDELTGMMNEAPGDREKLDAEVKMLQKDKAAKEKELAGLKNGGELAQRRANLAEEEAKMTKYKAEFDAEHTVKAGDAEKVVRGCKSEIERIEAEIERNFKDIERYEVTAETADKLAAGLRDDWNKIHAEPFPDNISDICPCCGQPLPTDKLERIRAEELKKFNLKKAERLKAIQEKGKNIMAGKERDLAAAANLKTANEEKQARITELTKSLEENQKLLEGTEKPDIKKTPLYIELAESIKMAERFVAMAEGDTKEACDTVEAEIENLATEISARQEKLAAFKKNNEMRERIEELKDREKDLGKLYSELEKQLFMTEEFLRAKVRATEESINSHFKYVRFKMFEQRINGALEECCEPIIDGVPFNDGLNKGNKMRAALDIVNALSKYYGISLPVFIDDCESYTSLPDVNAQVIKLIADGAYDKLTMIEE